MLGRRIHDHNGIEGPPQSIDGLGYLNIETTMTPKKNLSFVMAHTVKSQIPVNGYEIHIGETSGLDCDYAWLQLADRTEGAMSANGHVRGCYLHGLFASDSFRAEVLSELGTTSQLASYDTSVNDTLNQLAKFIERHLDVKGLISLAQEVGTD
jgi:adenosylcobyric acid synthase